jgi:cob(I)alamin adenosyltransferase
LKIYTRKGDQGNTGLRDGSRTSKAALRMECLGTIDELSACLGVALEHLEQQPTCAEGGPRLIANVNRIQRQLYELGAELADPKGKRRIVPRTITWLEGEIDRWTAKLPELHDFILPGGGPAGASFHLARTVCRRAERALVRLSEHEPVSPTCLAYLNRLADTLFVAARFAAKLGGFSDRIAAKK